MAEVDGAIFEDAGVSVACTYAPSPPVSVAAPVLPLGAVIEPYPPVPAEHEDEDAAVEAQVDGGGDDDNVDNGGDIDDTIDGEEAGATTTVFPSSAFTSDGGAAAEDGWAVFDDFPAALASSLPSAGFGGGGVDVDDEDDEDMMDDELFFSGGECPAVNFGDRLAEAVHGAPFGLPRLPGRDGGDGDGGNGEDPDNGGGGAVVVVPFAIPAVLADDGDIPVAPGTETTADGSGLDGGERGDGNGGTDGDVEEQAQDHVPDLMQTYNFGGMGTGERDDDDVGGVEDGAMLVMGGDIWASDAFSYDSPLKDLLDRSDFTLHDLLDEDELLQEVKSMNEPLLDFLRGPDVLLELASLLSDPPPDGGAVDARRSVRHPYMACEVICCDVAGILDGIIDGMDGTILGKVFSLLDWEGRTMCVRLAGYFEKVVTLLVQRRPRALAAYLRAGGLPLLRGFLRHIDNFSVLQLLQRLLLPPPADESQYEEEEGGGGWPSDDGGEDVDGEYDDADGCGPSVESFISSPVDCLSSSHVFRNPWTSRPDSVSLLVRSLTHAEGWEEAAHASELLVSLVQQSPMDSSFLVQLTTEPLLDEIVEAATFLVDDNFGPGDTPATSAVMLLESVVLQLGGYGCVPPTPPRHHRHQNGGAGRRRSRPRPQPADAKCLTSLLDAALPRLVNALLHPACASWTAETPLGPRAVLGLSRLRIVRLVESLVLLAHPPVDSLLRRHGAVSACLDLFFEFVWCSMVHQSVANMLVHVVEGGAERTALQSHLVLELRLLGRLVEAHGRNAEAVAERPDRPVRLGYMGHVIIVCQAIDHACKNGGEPVHLPMPMPMPLTNGNIADGSGRSAAEDFFGVEEAKDVEDIITDVTANVVPLPLTSLPSVMPEPEEIAAKVPLPPEETSDEDEDGTGDDQFEDKVPVELIDAFFVADNRVEEDNMTNEDINDLLKKEDIYEDGSIGNDLSKNFDLDDRNLVSGSLVVEKHKPKETNMLSNEDVTQKIQKEDLIKELTEVGLEEDKGEKDKDVKDNVKIKDDVYEEKIDENTKHERIEEDVREEKVIESGKEEQVIESGKEEHVTEYVKKEHITEFVTIVDVKEEQNIEEIKTNILKDVPSSPLVSSSCSLELQGKLEFLEETINGASVGNATPPHLSTQDDPLKPPYHSSPFLSASPSPSFPPDALHPDCPVPTFCSLIQILQSSPDASRWHHFVSTSLAHDAAVQSAPLGGYGLRGPEADLQVDSNQFHTEQGGLAVASGGTDVASSPSPTESGSAFSIYGAGDGSTDGDGGNFVDDDGGAFGGALSMEGSLVERRQHHIMDRQFYFGEDDEDNVIVDPIRGLRGDDDLVVDDGRAAISHGFDRNDSGGGGSLNNEDKEKYVDEAGADVPVLDFFVQSESLTDPEDVDMAAKSFFLKAAESRGAIITARTNSSDSDDAQAEPMAGDVGDDLAWSGGGFADFGSDDDDDELEKGNVPKVEKVDAMKPDGHQQQEDDEHDMMLNADDVKFDVDFSSFDAMVVGDGNKETNAECEEEEDSVDDQKEKRQWFFENAGPSIIADLEEGSTTKMDAMVDALFVPTDVSHGKGFGDIDLSKPGRVDHHDDKSDDRTNLDVQNVAHEDVSKVGGTAASLEMNCVSIDDLIVQGNSKEIEIPGLLSASLPPTAQVSSREDNTGGQIAENEVPS
eukprot:CAMPEP_0194320952 /NCGR_PEP_ID=MMETSP0171-20130528/17216_1 /TAXON_ID=218684 /ORGANISM="Corethron pennatum, Strain L29A3" /LENGTH=1675 /DNA_ID=CAMNT_0039078669 /DNA_START=110 /DNA_END=5137 /DNA_ORIENTATION=+